ncbi:GNAT family N-acetyltransferase [Elizabethkingia sp. HX QKY]|uniref:GNAT family N-acetyltransferase n=1 Tax=Elizabethkingia TaxID=308865 RepID=UPI0020120F61|nr:MULTISPECIES: GNAT family N-acetyltransferase [Elizabethkingia]MCL1677689.1 GNAT family N-acetyltransferase [Elizabethkingia miricola]MCP1253787.1 GNAT family N-acetyltransferase [Elizabethkingia sp. S0634]MDX8573527.1 GNAT family N-acetyltransferase [Elizabethkingia sp. HX QKY]
MALITMHKYNQDDFNVFRSLTDDDDLMKYVSGEGLSEEKAKAKFASILHVNSTQNSLGYFKIYNDQNIFIGDCKLEKYRHDNSLLEIGYILKKEFWGKGYGYLICKELLTLAEKNEPEMNIIGNIDPENIASKRLLEKSGFRSYKTDTIDGMLTESLILIRKSEV